MIVRIPYRYIYIYIYILIIYPIQEVNLVEDISAKEVTDVDNSDDGQTQPKLQVGSKKFQEFYIVLRRLKFS